MNATDSDPKPPPEGQPGHTTPLSLLQRARRNDTEAWHRLVALYRPLVLFWCGRAGLGGHDAEDVSQEVFAAASAGLARFHRDQPGDSFRGWLRGITRNQLLLHFRRCKGQPEAEGGSVNQRQLRNAVDPLTGADEDETVEINQLYRRILEQVRGEFEDRTWQAFWLTVIEDRTPASLVERLGMSAASIRQAKSRVLRRLKQEMGDLLG